MKYPHWHVFESDYGDVLDKAFATEHGAAIAATRFVRKNYGGDIMERLERDSMGGWWMWPIDQERTIENEINIGPWMCERPEDCWMEADDLPAPVRAEGVTR